MRLFKKTEGLRQDRCLAPTLFKTQLNAAIQIKVDYKIHCYGDFEWRREITYDRLYSLDDLKIRWQVDLKKMGTDDKFWKTDYILIRKTLSIFTLTEI